MNYYEILRVDYKASKDEIRAAYVTLVKIYHPDVSNDINSNEIFKIITEAYNVLIDDDKRRAYDLYIFRTKNMYNSGIINGNVFDGNIYQQFEDDFNEPNENSKWSRNSLSTFLRFGIIFLILVAACVVLKIFAQNI